MVTYRKGRRFLILALATVALGAAHPTWATLMVNYQVNFNEGAVLSGMFEGDDANNDMLIDSTEVTSWSALYTPGTDDFIGPVSLDSGALSNVLNTLSFSLVATQLTELYAVDSVTGEAIAYLKSRVAIPIEVLDASGNSNGIYQEVSQSNSVRDTAVPEPGVLALLSLGLVGLGFTRRRMKA